MGPGLDLNDMPGRYSPLIIFLLWGLFTSVAAHETWTRWRTMRMVVTPERIYGDPESVGPRELRFLIQGMEVGRLVSIPRLLGREELTVAYAVTADTSNLNLFNKIPFLRKISVSSTRLDIQGEVLYDVARSHTFLSADFDVQVNQLKGHLFATRRTDIRADIDNLEVWVNWANSSERYVVPWESCPLISLDPMASLSVPWLQEGTTWSLSTFDIFSGRDHRFLATAEALESIEIWGRRVNGWRVRVDDDNGRRMAQAWVSPDGRLLRCIYAGLLTVELVDSYGNGQ